MMWIAPSEEDSENAAPVLGLIFLRFAAQRVKLEKVAASFRCGSRLDELLERVSEIPASLDFDAVGHIYRQVDRAHREWTPAQIGFLASLLRLYRGETRVKIQELLGSARVSRAPSGVAPEGSSPRKVSGATLATAAGTAALPIQYRDIPGLCEAATSQVSHPKPNQG